MAAPIGPYQDTSESLNIESPMYQKKVELADGEKLTIDFLNATQMFQVLSITGTVQVYFHTGGPVAGAESDVLAGAWVPFVGQTKKIIVANGSGGSTVVNVHATLSLVKAADLPVLGGATGFDGIDSHASAVVA